MSGQTFLLPDLGEGLTEAEIVRWLVAEGDVVAVDQSIVEVETAKSIVEVPSPYAGRVATLHAGEGQTLDVGKPLITVAADAGRAVPCRGRLRRRRGLPRGGEGRLGQRADRVRHGGRVRLRASSPAARRSSRAADRRLDVAPPPPHACHG